MVVPLGTTLHELGHYAVAKFFYRSVSINYGSTIFNDYYSYIDESLAEILVIWGGPISTLLISMVASFFLLRLNKEFKFNKLIHLILALFISREILISLMILLQFNFTNTDEFKLFTYYNLDPNLGASILLVFSSIYCMFIIYKSLFVNDAIKLIGFGIIGSVCGFYFWNVLGRVFNETILPFY